MPRFRCISVLVLLILELSAAFLSGAPRAVIPISSLASATSADNGDIIGDLNDKVPAENDIRPFHQNWWPVTAVVSLDPSRPNSLQVLGQKLVAVFDSASKTWSVLDDRCSHRFAPLSEGRVLENDGRTCLQCAYHGWEFQADSGTCSRVPQQQENVDKANPVQCYPVRREGGMLWVWMDPATETMAKEIPLPISPLVKQRIDTAGEGTIFMRDLPYGMELLGENLLDLAHLPFSHHSVGGLRRELGGPLPTRMLSEEERVENASWERAFSNVEPVLPRYQAEIVDAADHDPVYLSLPRMGNVSNWTTTIGFYDPAHVRYRRHRGPGKSIHVELFLCPTSEGRSRVFLYNLFETPSLPSAPVVSVAQKIKRIFNPNALNGLLKSYIERRLIKPGAADGHLFSHQIFDGDGIFLHKQGNRMKDAGLTFRDYSTPSSADVLLNAYRRFLDAAARRTRDADLRSSAEAVVGISQYGDDLERAIMLDRYESHTKDCPICSSALEQTRQNLSRVRRLQTFSQGAVGASVATLFCLVASRLASVSLARPVLPIALITTAVSSIAALGTIKAEAKLDKRIEQFLFEDYVHADKN